MRTILILVLAGWAIGCVGDDPLSPILPGSGGPAEPEGPTLGAVSSAVASISPTVTVDSSSATGLHTSLTIDSTGRRHLVYYDSTYRDLRYATCAANCSVSTGWQRTTIDQGGDVGSYASIDVASSGRLHLTYYDATNGDLKYATCAGSCTLAANWQKVPVDQLGNVGLYSSLAADTGTGSVVHVTYYDASRGDLKYARCSVNCTSAANWQRVAIDQPGTVGLYSSLARDLRTPSTLRVSYYDATNGNLKYATCSSATCVAATSWLRATVDYIGNVGQFTSLGIDSAGVTHIGYHDATNYDLKYARCAVSCLTPASWRLAVLDPSGFASQHTSLAIAPGGALHIAYQGAVKSYRSVSQGLKHATCLASCNAASNWQKSVLDGSSANVGLYSSLALGANGGVRVGYYDAVNQDLKYSEQ